MPEYVRLLAVVFALQFQIVVTGVGAFYVAQYFQNAYPAPRGVWGLACACVWLALTAGSYVTLFHRKGLRRKEFRRKELRPKEFRRTEPSLTPAPPQTGDKQMPGEAQDKP